MALCVVTRVAARAMMASLLAAGISFGAFAQDANVGVKVGFVNVARVLEEAKQAEDARDRIEEVFQPRELEVLEQRRTLRVLEDELLEGAPQMSRDERARREAEIRALKRDVRRAQDEFREELNLARSKELGSLQRKVIEVIRELADAQNYDLIVSDGVIFAGKRIDLTDEVLSRLASELGAAE